MSKIVGFTLAETLIELGIVGIVSIITIPTIISNVQSYVKGKRIENIQHKFSEATDKMLALNGMNGYGSTVEFVNELKNHLKLAKICSNSDLRSCWPTETVMTDGKEWEIANTKTGKNLKMTNDDNNDWDNTVGIVTSDGVPMILSYNKKCAMESTLLPNWLGSKSSSTNCVAAVYDWNGGKNPNTFGMSTTDRSDVMPLNANGLGSSCSFEVDGKCFGAFFVPSGLPPSECVELQSKGMIKYCTNDDDYWAQAVKMCGGTDKMPTTADLAALYQELKKGDWETNTANIGLPTSFKVWTGHENGYNGADIYVFEENDGRSSITVDRVYYTNLRNYGVCLVD